MADSPLNPSITGSRQAGPLRGMYNALVSLQKRHLEALRTGEGRGLSTVEMAEHLERESGYRDLYEALADLRCRGCGWAYGEVKQRDCKPCGNSQCDKARASIAKARGEKPDAT